MRRIPENANKTVVELTWEEKEGDLVSKVDALLNKFKSIVMKNNDGTPLSFWSKQSPDTDNRVPRCNQYST